MHPTATHYEVLAVSSTASTASIRRAYLQRSLQWHPDRPSGSSSVMLFARASAAYEVLCDPARRKLYDATLRRVVTDVVALRDMQRDGEGGRSMKCRCGGAFEVGDGELEDGGGVVVVECDTCSLALRVVEGASLEIVARHAASR